jgi:hypothetical protein
MDKIIVKKEAFVNMQPGDSFLVENEEQREALAQHLDNLGFRWCSRASLSDFTPPVKYPYHMCCSKHFSDKRDCITYATVLPENCKKVEWIEPMQKNKTMRKAQVGDKIIITATRGYYYSVGDIGVILRIDRVCCEVDFNNQRNKNVVGDGIWWVGYYSDDPNKLELYEENEKGFSSQQQIWEYLISGGKVCKTNWDTSFYSLIEGKVHRTRTDGVSTGWTSNFLKFTDYEKYVEPSKWYENIPKQGILCWVWYKGDKGKDIAIVLSYDKNERRPFNTKNAEMLEDCGYDFATPLTEEEVKQYIYKQN